MDVKHREQMGTWLVWALETYDSDPRVVAHGLYEAEARRVARRYQRKCDCVAAYTTELV